MTRPDIESLDDLGSFEALFETRLNLPWTYGDEITVMEEHHPDLADAWKRSAQLWSCLYSLAGSVNGEADLHRMLEEAAPSEPRSSKTAVARPCIQELLEQLAVHDQVLHALIAAWAKGTMDRYATIEAALDEARIPEPDDHDLDNQLKAAVSAQQAAVLALARQLDEVLQAQT